MKLKLCNRNNMWHFGFWVHKLWCLHFVSTGDFMPVMCWMEASSFLSLGNMSFLFVMAHAIHKSPSGYYSSGSSPGSTRFKELLLALAHLLHSSVIYPSFKIQICANTYIYLRWRYNCCTSYQLTCPLTNSTIGPLLTTHILPGAWGSLCTFVSVYLKRDPASLDRRTIFTCLLFPNAVPKGLFSSFTDDCYSMHAEWFSAFNSRGQIRKLAIGPKWGKVSAFQEPNWVLQLPN